MTMRLSPAGIAALVKHEGIVPGPYLDSVGEWTYGIGHTKSAGAPDPDTLSRGMPADLDAELKKVVEVFKRDIRTFEDRVNEHVKVPLTQEQFDALVSFDFNTGGIYYREKATGKMRNATLVDTLNKGNYTLAGDQFMNWRTPASIIGRREEERALFLRKLYPSGSANVWQVNKDGKVIWTPCRVLTQTELLGLVLGDEVPAAPITLDPSAIESTKRLRFLAGTYSASIDEQGNLSITTH